MDEGTKGFFGGILAIIFFFLVIFWGMVTLDEKYIRVSINDKTGLKIVNHEGTIYRLVPMEGGE